MGMTLDEIAATWFVRPGAVVWDIGVHEGATSMLYLAHGAATVIGFEPRAAARKAMPAQLIGDPRFKLMPFALGQDSGAADMIVPPGNPGAATLRREFFEASPRNKGTLPVTESVEVHRVDDLTGTRAAQFWKIDAEGSELEILRGATQTLSRAKPAAMQIEIFLHDRARYLETLNLLRDLYPHLWAVGFSDAGEVVIYEVTSRSVSSQRFHAQLGRTGTPRYFVSDRPLQAWLQRQ